MCPFSEKKKVATTSSLSAIISHLDFRLAPGKNRIASSACFPMREYPVPHRNNTSATVAAVHTNGRRIILAHSICVPAQRCIARVECRCFLQLVKWKARIVVFVYIVACLTNPTSWRQLIACKKANIMPDHTKSYLKRDSPTMSSSDTMHIISQSHCLVSFEMIERVHILDP
jgi:hypothetical protein